MYKCHSICFLTVFLKYVFRTGQQGGQGASGQGLALPLEQPAEQGSGLSSYTAPRPIQGSSETIVSQNKQDFRFESFLLTASRWFFYCSSLLFEPRRE